MLKYSVKLMTTAGPIPSLLWRIVSGSRKVAKECRLHCQRVEIEEVDVRPAEGLMDPDKWEAEISRAGAGGAIVYSDGSLLERGNVGGGAFIEVGREKQVECGIGDAAMVWDGEVTGMAEARKMKYVERG